MFTLPAVRRIALALGLALVAAPMVVTTSPAAADEAETAAYSPQMSGGVPSWRYPVPIETEGELILDSDRNQSVHASPDGIVVTDLDTLQSTRVDGASWRAASHRAGDDSMWLLHRRGGTTPQLVEFDLGSLQRIRSISLGPDDGCADDVAVLPDHVVVTFGCYAARPVAAVDRTTGDVQRVAEVATGERVLNLRLTAQRDDAVIVYEVEDDDAAQLRRVRITDTGPTITSTRTLPGVYVQDVSASPTTGHVVVVSHDLDEARELHATTLADRPGYLVGSGGAFEVTHTADGDVLVVTGEHPRLRQYRPGAHQHHQYFGDDAGTHLTVSTDGANVATQNGVTSDGTSTVDVFALGHDYGAIRGVLSRAAENGPGFGIDQGRVDIVRASDLSYVGTIWAEPSFGGRAQYVVNGLPVGDYHLLAGNGDGRDLDYFSEWYRAAPLFRVDRAQTITVQADRAAVADVALRPLFEDMWDSPFTDEIYFMGNSGITAGCNPAQDNTRYCPDDVVTRGAMAAFLVRALGLTDDGGIEFRDTAGHVFERDIARLAAADITRGCNPPDNDRFCPDAPVTRGQMAAFLTRAFGLPRAEMSFRDTRGHTFEADVARLADAGITRGCNPPDNSRFCPDDAVTRGQMAAFLFRSFEWLGTELGLAAMDAPTGPDARAGAMRTARPDLTDR